MVKSDPLKQVIPFCIFWIVFNCSDRKPEQQDVPKVVVSDSRSSMAFARADSMFLDEGASTEEDDPGTEDDQDGQARKTRVRFPGFTVVFHNFTGYIRDEGNQYVCQFGSYYASPGAELNDSEMDSVNYVETLIANNDTVSLSEILFDDRINNTPIQIVPNDSSDRFELSFCYLSLLGEIIDHRGLSSQELESRQTNMISFNESTAYYKISDSARYYFTALPHTPDMVEVKVENGALVSETNTPAQISWEQNQWIEEFKRIKDKYGLRDTTVVIPGEYTTVADLTKDKKLFGYGYQSFLFRIARYKEDKLLDTNYIVIAIAYGC